MKKSHMDHKNLNISLKLMFFENFDKKSHNESRLPKACSKITIQTVKSVPSPDSLKSRTVSNFSVFS